MKGLARGIISRILCLMVCMAGMVSVLCACGKLDEEYNSRYQCYFVFDYTIHPASLLKSCTNPLAPGNWAMVSSQPNGATISISTSLYGGQSEVEKIMTEKELRQSCILGVGNALVIGCSSLNGGMLYVYDRQCPNCLEQHYPLVNYALQWDNNGQWLKCTTCNRNYDLNNSGFIVKGDNGQKLIRYRANSDAMTLRVHN